MARRWQRSGGGPWVGLAVVIVTASIGAAGCSSGPPQRSAPAVTPSPQAADRDALAALAAAAKDRRYGAHYRLEVPQQPARTVVVIFATDGSWQVTIPASGLGGQVDLAMFSSGRDLWQCALGPAVVGCARVVDLDSANDPQVQHIFTDWIDALVDRATALSVTAAVAPPGADGSCFSVESNSVALVPPVEPGLYCYRGDGILTAARLRLGALTLIGPVSLAPATVAAPAELVDRPPVPITAPENPPSPTKSP